MAQIANDNSYTPKDPRELASRIFYTAYMGTANSSAETRQRAADLAKDIGACHTSFNIDVIIGAVISVFEATTGRVPKFRVCLLPCLGSRDSLLHSGARARFVNVLKPIIHPPLPLGCYTTATCSCYRCMAARCQKIWPCRIFRPASAW